MDKFDEFYRRLAIITQTEQPYNIPLSSNLQPEIQTNLEQGLETQKNTTEYQKTKDDKDYRLDTASIYEKLLTHKIALLQAQKVKLSYVSHQKGHRNSLGELAEWVVRDHSDGHIISSHKTEDEAKSHLRDMQIHKNQ